MTADAAASHFIGICGIALATILSLIVLYSTLEKIESKPPKPPKRRSGRHRKG